MKKVKTKPKAQKHIGTEVLELINICVEAQMNGMYEKLEAHADHALTTWMANEQIKKEKIWAEQVAHMRIVEEYLAGFNKLVRKIK